MFLSLLGAVVLSGAISAFFAYRSGLTQVDELFDAKLAHSARVLAALLDSFPSKESSQPLAVSVPLWAGEFKGDGDDLATASGHAYETKLAFQIWRGDQLEIYSTNAPSDSLLAPHEAGFHNVQLGGEWWRSFVMRSPSGRWYIAGEHAYVRGELAEQIAAQLLVPLLLQIPVLAFLIAAVIHFGRRSLAAVTRQVRNRAADRLDPLELRNVPTEIRGVAEAVNSLLADLAEALQRERRFTADAAHELRTPLAALRVLIANCHSAPSEAERLESMQKLDRAAQRLERLVSQMLTLSRLEPSAEAPAVQRVDLVDATREVMVEIGSLDMARPIDLELCAPDEPLCVLADPVAVQLVVRNLVDNAIRYTGKGRVLVTIERHVDRIRLQVEDSGPGIPPGDRSRVLDRFFRQLGHGQEGSGLGLSIVRRVVEIYDATLELGESSTLAGLRARIEFKACDGG